MVNIALLRQEAEMLVDLLEGRTPIDYNRAELAAEIRARFGMRPSEEAVTEVKPHDLPQPKEWVQSPRLTQCLMPENLGDSVDLKCDGLTEFEPNG